MPGRGPTLKPGETTRALRVRGPKAVLEKLERLRPEELGAWVYHAEDYFKENAPELSLEHPPQPIPGQAFAKALNPKLAALLQEAKPMQWTKAWNAIGLTDSERQADEAYWQERQAERKRERRRIKQREARS